MRIKDGCSKKKHSTVTCADPESFVRGGTTFDNVFFFFFFVFEARDYLVFREERIKILLKADHHRHASETPFKLCFAGVLMVAKH